MFGHKLKKVRNPLEVLMKCHASAVAQSAVFLIGRSLVPSYASFLTYDMNWIYFLVSVSRFEAPEKNTKKVYSESFSGLNINKMS